MFSGQVNWMKQALSSRGALSAYVDASSLRFRFYSTGIVSDDLCGTELNHAVNVVGWGQSLDIEYWIIRNSWSDKWGEQGYMRLQIV